jgi:hypothetical protein
MWKIWKKASGKNVSCSGINVSILVHVQYQSDAVASFIMQILYCVYDMYLSLTLVFLKLKIIHIEKQHRFCEIMKYSWWLKFYCALIVLWQREVSYVVHKHFSGTYCLHLQGFQRLCCFINLKDHNLNTDMVRHFYKIPTFMIQKYKFLKSTCRYEK